ncbi:MAG TPA: Holliday junction resolvase RuvX [Candidatus Paceibacterota bacterium]
MKYIGIDYGSKRIGLAVGDDVNKIAFPLFVLANDKNFLGKLEDICKEKKIEAIVLGQSLDYKGVPNKIQDKISEFKSEIAKLTGLSVSYQAEHFSSAEASRSTNKVSLDSAAAALILQSYLDKTK